MKRSVSYLVLACVIGFGLSGCSSAPTTQAPSGVPTATSGSVPSSVPTAASGSVTSPQNSQATPAPGGPSKQSGTFLSYQLVDTDTTAQMPGGVVGANGDTFEPSGKALVKLANGVQVAAACSIQNLKPNDTVVVKRDSKGAWAVISKS